MKNINEKIRHARHSGDYRALCTKVDVYYREDVWKTVDMFDIFFEQFTLTNLN